MGDAKRDQNRIPTLLGVSNADGVTPVTIWADPVTHRLLVDYTGGTVTVDVGTTTTLPPGSVATVINTGDTTDAVFAFGIPAGSVIHSTIVIPDNSVGVDGDWAFSTAVGSEVYFKSAGAWALVNTNRGATGATGATGPTGPIGLVWKGAYDAGTTYNKNEGVSYLGSSYIYINNTPASGQTPAVGAYWDLLAVKGTDGEGSGDVSGPASSVADNIALFNGITGKIIKDGGAKLSDFQTALGYTAENVVNKSTSVSTDGSSDTKYPSVKAIKDYADGLVSGLLDFRGAYDASGNAYPTTGGSGTAGAVMKGDMWIISVAGTLGGEAVQIGDSIIANTDTPGQTASNWNHLNGNISYVPENVANKVTSISGASTDTQYPSAKLTYDQLALKEVTSNKENSTIDTSTTKYPTVNLLKTGLDAKINNSLVDAKGDIITATADNTPARLAVGTNGYVLTADSGEATGLKYVDVASRTETLTNKRITPRVSSEASSATPTINTDNCDIHRITALTTDITSMTTNLSGTPTHGQTLIIEITGTAARAITWGTSFEASTVALPTTTVTTAMLSVGFKYNSATSKWRCLASA